MLRRCRHDRVLPALVLLAAMAAGACGDEGRATAPAGEEASTTLRLGYLPNVTHATAIAGVHAGIFERALGGDELEVSTFNAGPAAVEALFSGALDAAYIGPNPAINAFVKSKGQAVRIISGATSGGASLIVDPEISEVGQLRGKKIASPQLGGSQDVALRHWLGENGLRTRTFGGGDVSILPQENAQTLETFKLGEIDGAWVPEPWATRLRLEGGGKALVNESSIWPNGRFVTTHLVVRAKFLEEHPGTVRRLLEGHVETNDLLHADAGAAQKLVNDGIEEITTERLKDDVMRESWKNLEFTNDPVASSLRVSARHAVEVDLLENAELGGIYDLTLLNELLTAAGREEIST